MKFITYAGETIALVLAAANWAEPVKLTLTLPFTDIETALSARESRRVLARSSRYSFEYTPLFDTVRAAEEFRLGLNRLKTETVVVPLWCDFVEVASAFNASGIPQVLDLAYGPPARSGASWIILSRDASTYEIVTVSSVTGATIALASNTLNWPAGTVMFPLLFGRFEERPELESLTDEVAEGRLKFREDSDYARRINPVSGAIATVGAGIPAFSTLPIWNVQPHWSRVLDRTEVDVIYESLGFGRKDASYAYQQSNRRGLELEFWQEGRAAIAAVERLFVDRRGPVRPLMVPTFRGDLRITQDLPIVGSTTRINIEATDYTDATRPVHPGDPYFALVDPNSVDPQKVLDVHADYLLTQVAIAQAHSLTNTKLSHLLLARLTEPVLSWTYDHDGLATTRLKFIERPDEYLTPAPDLQERARLYHFTERRDPATSATWVHSYFTSYEASLVKATHTYAPAPYEHGEVPNKLSLDDKVDLTSWDFAGNPLRKILTQRLEGNLILEIIDVSVIAPDDGSARIIFAGQVGSLDPSGKKWKAEVAWRKRVLDRPVPNAYKQRPCNTTCYSRYCGLNPAAFLVTGNFTSLAGQEVHVSAGADKPANWFAGGGQIKTALGTTNFERRGILSSTPITGGVRLIVDQPFYLAASGQSAQVIPTCSRMLSDDTGRSCIAWGNRINFRAFEYVPDELLNPAGQSAQTPGGKK